MTDLDAIWQTLGALSDALDAADEARRQARAARRNTPEARTIRSDAARRGWEKRHAREAAKRATESAEDAWRDQLNARTGTGPWCNTMDLDAIGRETFCIRDPDHDGDCEDVNGHTWPNYDKE